MRARAQEALGRIRVSWGDYLAASEADPTSWSCANEPDCDWRVER